MHSFIELLIIYNILIPIGYYILIKVCMVTRMYLHAFKDRDRVD